MLHRAIFGSLERFFGVYLEHCGGNFPAWLAPEQAIVLTVSEKSDAYAAQVVERLRAQGACASRPTSSSDKLGAKIRNARLLRYPYMLVVGAEGGRERRGRRALARRGRARRHEARRVRCRLLAEARSAGARLH